MRRKLLLVVAIWALLPGLLLCGSGTEEAAALTLTPTLTLTLTPTPSPVPNGPYIDNIEPARGAPGIQITIRGKNFDDITLIRAGNLRLQVS